VPTGKVEKARIDCKEATGLMPACPEVRKGTGEATMPKAMPQPVPAPSQMSKAGRIAKIVQLRDRAMALLREHSKCHDRGGGHKMMCRDTEHLKITYAGPFQKWATDTSETKRHFQTMNSVVHLPHMLGVWWKDPFKKVLFIEWSDEGKIEVVSYKRGDWEAHLLE
jgi:hypothetical protein